MTDTDRHPDGTAAARSAFDAAGLTVRADGRLLYVEIDGDDQYDTVRDAVAGLGLGLVRMEQRRHRIAEVFRADGPERPDGNHQGGTGSAA